MSLSRKLSSLALVVLGFAAVACSKDDDPTDPSDVTIALTPTRDTIFVGETTQLNADVEGTDETAVTWTSSSEARATVDEFGMVTGVSAGNATITAKVTAEPTVKATSTITVLAAQGPSSTLLTSGVALTNRSGAAGSKTLYRIVVPAGMAQLNITTSGGTGDADIAVNFGSAPIDLFDGGNECVSAGADNGEICNIFNPASGTYFILVEGSTSYSGMSIVATASSQISSTLLTSGTPLTGRSGAVDSETLYRIVVPAGTKQLTITTSGGTGDVDIAAQFSVPPTPSDSSYSCLSFNTGNTQRCDAYDPPAGTIYILLIGTSAYSGVTLTATASNSYTAPLLTSGVALTGQSADAGNATLYRIVVPAGKTSLTVNTSGGTGDADLMVRRGLAPNIYTSSFDCASFNDFNTETCTINSPVAGDFFIMLYGYSPFTGVTVTATTSP